MNEDKINEIASSIQKETQKIITEEGLNDIFKDALIREPFYDEDNKILIYSMDSRVNNFEGEETPSTGIFALFFNKEGVVSVSFYNKTDLINKIIPDINTILDSFTYDDDFKYKP